MRKRILCEVQVLIDRYFEIAANSDLAVWLQHRYDRRPAEPYCFHLAYYTDVIQPIKLVLNLGSKSIWHRSRFEQLEVGVRINVEMGFESFPQR